MVKILLLDNQLLTAQGIITLLAEGNYVVMYQQYQTPTDIHDAVENHQPDMIIIDPFDNDGALNEQILTAIADVATRWPVVILTNIAQVEHIKLLLNAGALGHLSKQSTNTEIFDCLRSALRGKPYQCNKTRELLANESSLRPLTELLSDREKEILILIADGKSDKEIADNLFLSFHTVRTHRKNIGRKLGFSLKNAAELTLLANSLR